MQVKQNKYILGREGRGEREAEKGGRQKDREYNLRDGIV